MTRHFIDLKDLAADKVSFQDTFALGVVDFSADSVRQVAPLEWKATAERAGGEIRVTGSLKTSVELTCSRCLEPANYNLARDFDLFFRQRDEMMYDEDQEIELAEEDTRTAFFTGTQLAIGDMLHEQVLLGLPMKALCKVDCKGLCPTCGTNLNTSTCNCPREQFSPHMDALLELKRRLEERSS